MTIFTKVTIGAMIVIPLWGGDMLDIVKNDLLKTDPLYMNTHREEALLVKFQTGPKESQSIPKRTPDKFISIFVYPYVDSNDAYHDETNLVLKYKTGEWFFGDKVNLDDNNDVDLSSMNDPFTIVKSDPR